MPKENAADLSDQSLEADYYIEDGKYKIDLKPLLKEKYWFDKVHLSLLHVEKYGASMMRRTPFSAMILLRMKTVIL